MSKTYVEPTNPTSDNPTSDNPTSDNLTSDQPIYDNPTSGNRGNDIPTPLPRIGGRNWVGRRASKARLVQSSISFSIPFLFIYLFI